MPQSEVRLETIKRNWEVAGDLSTVHTRTEVERRLQTFSLRRVRLFLLQPAATPGVRRAFARLTCQTLLHPLVRNRNPILLAPLMMFLRSSCLLASYWEKEKTRRTTLGGGIGTNQTSRPRRISWWDICHVAVTALGLPDAAPPMGVRKRVRLGTGVDRKAIWTLSWKYLILR